MIKRSPALPATFLQVGPASSPVGTADPARPRGCTNFRLRRLTRRVSQHYDAEMAHCGIKATQYSLLSHVLHLGPIRPADLAREMTMDASTLTRNLKPLVAAGWLVIGPGADDRSRLITLTPEGRAKRSEAQRHWRAAQQALNQALGNEQVVALHALIDGALAKLTETEAETENERPAGR